MALLLPTIQNIKRLKVKPTEGELFLLEHLTEHLSDDYELYYEPFLNGDRPDIVIIRKNHGVTIIEVKDWDLDKYSVDENNHWFEGNNGAKIRSPFQQVFQYKHNLFGLHLNAQAEKKAANLNFYNIIHPYVYFHYATKSRKDSFYSNVENMLKDKMYTQHSKFRNIKISIDAYEKNTQYIERKQQQVRKNKSIAVTHDSLRKITNSLDSKHFLFEDSIYQELKRCLNPPYHLANQGKDISYDKKQQLLIVSSTGYQKIKGVAGSGKTMVLSKRAVNAHKRHDEAVLVLTFNKTLKSYIHDKISEVRENFSWDSFCIINYHLFIKQMLNQTGIDDNPPEGSSREQTDEYYKTLFSNLLLFDGKEAGLTKYKSIFIDEVQDYMPEWIKIIRKCFLAEEGEMVLFCDENQSIYERDSDENKCLIMQGFGRWENLNTTYRYKSHSHIENK
ncbi:MAG: superfamily I DNA and RNA helicase [Pseudohongiellaceae bacterium]|jgi:superfamily I DNA and RNA helicase